MNNFISTSGGKIVNVNAIAFLTSRTREATAAGEGGSAQLVVGFSAAGTVGQSGLLPLSLVMSGREALEFLDQLEARGVVVEHLRRKIS
jgi:hypothetical protein